MTTSARQAVALAGTALRRLGVALCVAHACGFLAVAATPTVRLARGFTKRDKIIKFSGCYHGHSDSLLIKAGSGALTHGHPDSAGIPASFARETDRKSTRLNSSH